MILMDFYGCNFRTIHYLEFEQKKPIVALWKISLVTSGGVQNVTRKDSKIIRGEIYMDFVPFCSFYARFMLVCSRFASFGHHLCWFAPNYARFMLIYSRLRSLTLNAVQFVGSQKHLHQHFFDSFCISRSDNTHEFHQPGGIHCSDLVKSNFPFFVQ